jgi:hypothetical protein
VCIFWPPGQKAPVKWAVIQAVVQVVFEEAFTIGEFPLDAPKPVTPTAWKHGWDGKSTTPLQPANPWACKYKGMLGHSSFVVKFCIVLVQRYFHICLQ